MFCQDLFFFFFGEHLRLCPWSLASSIPVLGLESVCPRKGCPWPWPRIFFVSLASSLVSSTPPLQLTYNYNIAIFRGEVLEDVLEDRFWSPWSWPQSLTYSKIALSSARGLHYYFLNRWNFVGKCQNLAENLRRTFFCFPQVEIAWKKFLKTFFWDCLKNFLENLLCFGEHLRLCPWS